MIFLRSLGILLIAQLLVPAAVTGQEVRLSAEELQQDLDALVATVERTHPDLGYVADRKEVARVAASIRAELDRPLTLREAWLSLARLNPYFADAHAGLRHPAAEFDAYRSNGGAAFPVPVIVDRDGILRAGATTDPLTGICPFEEIVSINGRASGEIVKTLMPLMRGETESLRRLVLAFNFPGHLWALTGPASEFRLVVRGADGRTRALAVTSVSAPSKPPQPSLTFPRADLAWMRIPSFDPGLRSAFSSFLDQSIAQIEKRGVTRLLIDIRDNPGGAHDVSDQLVAWLSAVPVSPTSRLTARITPDNKDLAPDAPVGAVVTLPFSEPISPRADGKRFGGDVYVLMNENSYSQAIVFGATIRDHKLGKLAGETTGGAANQTGQIKIQALPNSKLQALAPLYIIYRASGDTSRAGLAPDIEIHDEPTAPMAMIESLLAKLTQTAR